jgi:hypothetical protein
VSEAAAEARLEPGRFLPYRLSVTAECTSRLFAVLDRVLERLHARARSLARAE